MPEQNIAEAVRLLFALANLKSEPTGALSVAAVMTNPELFLGVIGLRRDQGGNFDPVVYAQLILK